jgi:hypothetical protein
LENSPAGVAIPAAARASGSAGITPPFAAMAARLSAPPSAISQRKGTCAQFAATKAAMDA